ncbi:hypothetical protein BC833DRAFT_592417 [Globomyces pollinis-pini]|nr:hypothetical protein BC833DRAFT_592417 [Globomyces pollinis-pini]
MISFITSKFWKPSDELVDLKVDPLQTQSLHLPNQISSLQSSTSSTYQHNAIQPLYFQNRTTNQGNSDMINVNTSSPLYWTFIKFLYKLTAIWYISIATGSVILSIPIASFSLPLILVCGVFSFLVSLLISFLSKLYISFIVFTWNTLKKILFSSNGIFGIVNSVFKKVGSIFSSSAPISDLPTTQLQRRPSTSSKHTDRSRHTDRSMEDYNVMKWRYYDNNSHYEDYRFQKPSMLSASVNYDELNLDQRSPQLSNRSINSDHKRDREDYAHSKRSNANSQTSQTQYAFHYLTVEQTHRLDLCKQLYLMNSSEGNDEIELLIGTQTNGDTHHILSVWNELDPFEPVEFSQLIGFCEYFISPSRPNTLHIDKLNISSMYSESRFSRLILQRLMSLPHTHAIQVWSLWHVEPFYRAIGFSNVIDPVKRKRIQATWGPLLMWKNYDKIMQSHHEDTSRTITSPKLTPKDSIPSLKSKDSNSTLNNFKF